MKTGEMKRIAVGQAQGQARIWDLGFRALGLGLISLPKVCKEPQTGHHSTYFCDPGTALQGVGPVSGSGFRAAGCRVLAMKPVFLA